MRTMSTLVQAKELSKCFGKLVVYEELNFEVRGEEFVSIIGPSGCGKTTLLRILGGLIQPTTGEVRIRGKPVKAALGARELGFVFQNPVLLPWRTAENNVRLPLEIVGSKDSAAIPRELLKIVGLEGFENAL